MSGSIIRPNSCRSCAYAHREDNQMFCRAHPPMTQAIAGQNPQTGQVQVITSESGKTAIRHIDGSTWVHVVAE